MIERITAALAGHYKILREIGSGGMATVYLAEDIKHHRQVAVKVLRPDLVAPTGRSRFLREVEILAHLQHTNILPLLDSGEADGLVYYVMPFVTGESLGLRLQRERGLPVREAVRILGEMADALTYAHRMGVVHRDIKPDNVLFSEGHVVIADFGVAIATSEVAALERLTQTGYTVGTPLYMAPEQAAADPLVDHRADIYALGSVGYELLTGDPPFRGNSLAALLAAQAVRRPDSPSLIRPAIPSALSEIVLRCLEMHPADRFQDAREVREALDRLPSSTSEGAARPAGETGASRRWTRRSVLLAGGLGLLLLAAGGLWVLDRPRPLAVLTSTSQLTRLPGVEESPTISPDGKSVAYRAQSNLNSPNRLELQRVDGGDALEIPGSLVPVSWAPAGDRLMVRGANGLEVIPVLGGQGTVVDGQSLSGAWSPNGEEVAFFTRDTLFVQSAAGEGRRTITVAKGGHSPAWSPDGRWIAFVNGNPFYLSSWNVAPSSIELVAARGGAPRQLTPSDGVAVSPAWAPDSRRLLVVMANGSVRDVYQLDLTSEGALRRPPRRVSTGLDPSLISLSADGRMLAYSVAALHSNIWKIRAPKAGSVSSRDAVPVTTEIQLIEAFAISPDGRWLAFDSDRDATQQIYRMPLTGGAIEQVTHDSAPAFSPSLSPDGSEVAYQTVANGVRRVFVTTIPNGKPVQLSPEGPANNSAALWSPDGHRLAWGQTPPGVVLIATRDSAGRWGEPTPVLKMNNHLQGWADRGTLLFDRDSSHHPVLRPVEGGPVQPLPEFPAKLTRYALFQESPSSDGRTLYVDYRIGDQMGVFALQLPGGQARDVLHFDEPFRPHQVGRERNMVESGGWLYFTLSDEQSDVWVATVNGLAK